MISIYTGLLVMSHTSRIEMGAHVIFQENERSLSGKILLDKRSIWFGPCWLSH